MREVCAGEVQEPQLQVLSWVSNHAPALAPARLPPARLFLDLCSGADAPVTSARSAMSRRCFRPVGLLSGEKIDLLDDATTFASLERLCASGLVGSAGAAPPPCAAFSRARLRSGGPPAVRSVAQPCGRDGLPAPQAEELRKSSLTHVLCRTLLSLVASRGGLIWMENLRLGSCGWARRSCRGAGRTPPTWHPSLPAPTLSLCTRPGRLPAIVRLFPRWHPCVLTPWVFIRRFRAFVLRMAFFSRAPLPTTHLHLPALWLKSLILFWTRGKIWFRLLPSWACWPSVPGRVEDGAPPSQTDVLGPLRKAWTSRLLDTGLHQHIAACLLSGVPLGIGSMIPQRSVIHPPAPPDSTRLPLQHIANPLGNPLSIMPTSWTHCWHPNSKPDGFGKSPVATRSCVLSTNIPPWVNWAWFWLRGARRDWWWIPPSLASLPIRSFRIVPPIRPSWTCAKAYHFPIRWNSLLPWCWMWPKPTGASSSVVPTVACFVSDIAAVFINASH